MPDNQKAAFRILGTDYDTNLEVLHAKNGPSGTLGASQFLDVFSACTVCSRSPQPLPWEEENRWQRVRVMEWWSLGVMGEGGHWFDQV
jgi:hypothetical protein